jgi:hypothetical protein
MNCVIPGKNIKTFAQAIHFLGKIGTHLFIEADQHQLTLRSLNDSDSVFSSLRLDHKFPNQNFFESYTGPVDTIKCKVLTKTLVYIFRSIRRVSEMRVFTEGFNDVTQGDVGSYIVFKIRCENGIVKTHRFQVDDCQILQAVFDRKESSYIQASVRHFDKLLEHLPKSDEMRIIAGRGEARLSSYYSCAPLEDGASDRNDEPVRSRSTMTELKLKLTDFDQFEIVGDPDVAVDLIFSYKEVKAILDFCEKVGNDSFTFWYTKPGCPICLSTDSTSGSSNANVEMIMATMMALDDPVDTHAPTQSQRSNAQNQSQGGFGSSQSQMPSSSCTSNLSTSQATGQSGKMDAHRDPHRSSSSAAGVAGGGSSSNWDPNHVSGSMVPRSRQSDAGSLPLPSQSQHSQSHSQMQSQSQSQDPSASQSHSDSSHMHNGGYDLPPQPGRVQRVHASNKVRDCACALLIYHVASVFIAQCSLPIAHCVASISLLSLSLTHTHTLSLSLQQFNPDQDFGDDQDSQQFSSGGGSSSQRGDDHGGSDSEMSQPIFNKRAKR